MTVFQFGVRVAAPSGGAPVGWGPVTRERVAREPVLAPLVQGRCPDAVIEGGPVPHRALVYFDREAASLAAAMVTAVIDLERSGLACVAVVPDDDLVTAAAVGSRSGAGPRRIGGLLRDGPPPVSRCGGEQVFRWRDVVAWLDTAPAPASVPATEPVLAAVNLALRLRRLVRADPVLAAAVRDLLAV